MKDYIIWEMKMEEIKTKQCLETLIVLWIKLTEMVVIKHKDFIDVVPIMLCRNSLWIMDS